MARTRAAQRRPGRRGAIQAAYEAEYGLAAAEQSALNFLLFIHADRRSKFTPFGVFSDERYHLVDGNDRIVQGLAASLPGQIRFGRRLVRVRRASDGRIELTFDTAGGTAIRRPRRRGAHAAVQRAARRRSRRERSLCRAPSGTPSSRSATAPTRR